MKSRAALREADAARSCPQRPSPLPF